MSAVEEYRKQRVTFLPQTPLRDQLADDAIAEMEAERDAAIHMATRSSDSYAELEAELERKELVCTRLRTSWREDTADLGRFDDALHSAYQDWLDDFPDDSPMDYDKWLALHVMCGKEMRAP